jgi:hypothetical protein
MNNSPALRRSPLGLFPGEPTPRLHDRVVEVLRTRHYSRHTEQSYIHWIRRFIRFHGGLQDGREDSKLKAADLQDRSALRLLQSPVLAQFPTPDVFLRFFNSSLQFVAKP